MEWQSNVNLSHKRTEYVLGIARQLQISEQEAKNIEEPIFKTASSQDEYIRLLKQVSI